MKQFSPKKTISLFVILFWFWVTLLLFPRFHLSQFEFSDAAHALYSYVSIGGFSCNVIPFRNLLILARHGHIDMVLCILWTRLFWHIGGMMLACVLRRAMFSRSYKAFGCFVASVLFISSPLSQSAFLQSPLFDIDFLLLPCLGMFIGYQLWKNFIKDKIDLSILDLSKK